MLARLSKATLRLLDLPVPPHPSSSLVLSEDEETLLLDIDTAALQALVFPIPDIRWQRVAAFCGRTISPVYKGIQNILAEDTEHIAKLLLELESLSSEDLHVDNEVDENSKASLCGHCVSSDTSDARIHSHNISLIGDVTPHERPVRKRRRSCSPQLDQTLVVPATHPSVPLIIITPCPRLPRETSCRVPLQDSAFGAKLTVPMHPAFNQCFPPQLPLLLPLHSEEWRFMEGHWRAVVPDLEEQARNGLFSRTFVIKKRPCRIPGSRPSTSDALP